MQLSLDRKSFIDILGEGQYDIAGCFSHPPEGIWGMPQEMLQQRPATGRTCKKTGQKSSDDAIARLWPRQSVKVKLASRNIACIAIPR